MKLLLKYYRWRLKNASELDKTKWKYKIYKVTTYKNNSFGGLDLTFFTGDTTAYKEELTAGIDEIEPPDYHRTLAYDNRDAGRYLIGPQEWEFNEETKRWEDKSDWRVTPQEWADDKEKNQMHMPTISSRTSKGYTQSRDHKAWKKKMGYE